MLGLRPPGLEFRILCLEDSVISIISPSLEGSPGPVWPICAERWPKARFISFFICCVPAISRYQYVWWPSFVCSFRFLCVFKSKIKDSSTQVLQASYCPALVIVLAIELAPLVLFLVQDSGRTITTTCLSLKKRSCSLYVISCVFKTEQLQSVSNIVCL